MKTYLIGLDCKMFQLKNYDQHDKMYKYKRLHCENNSLYEGVVGFYEIHNGLVTFSMMFIVEP